VPEVAVPGLGLPGWLVACANKIPPVVFCAFLWRKPRLAVRRACGNIPAQAVAENQLAAEQLKTA
jgi:hypothetical protein